jgi:hypothetical protein
MRVSHSKSVAYPKFKLFTKFGARIHHLEYDQHPELLNYMIAQKPI